MINYKMKKHKIGVGDLILVYNWLDILNYLNKDV